jgi:hypothetical protein
MAIDLIRRHNCHNFIIVEKSSYVGGTWGDNRYPGSRCDGIFYILRYEHRMVLLIKNITYSPLAPELAKALNLKADPHLCLHDSEGNQPRNVFVVPFIRLILCVYLNSQLFKYLPP